MAGYHEEVCEHKKLKNCSECKDLMELAMFVGKSLNPEDKLLYEEFEEATNE